MNNQTILFSNEFLLFYINDTDVYLESTSLETQTNFNNVSTLTEEEKMHKLYELMEYFYNFWKLIETANDNKLYTMYFNINLVEIKVNLSFFLKIKELLDSLRSVIETKIKESYFKVEHKLAKYFLDMLLMVYKPIKPVHII